MTNRIYSLKSCPNHRVTCSFLETGKGRLSLEWISIKLRTVCVEALRQYRLQTVTWRNIWKTIRTGIRESDKKRIQNR